MRFSIFVIAAAHAAAVFAAVVPEAKRADSAIDGERFTIPHLHPFSC
jgi:hypothetical protein